MVRILLAEDDASMRAYLGRALERAGYDVVSVEFTDTSEVLDYHGGSIIFNTALGARNAGFIYSAPKEGYSVRVED